MNCIFVAFNKHFRVNEETEFYLKTITESTHTENLIEF